MIKTLKWVYGLGVKHERMRIKLLIADARKTKPNKPNSSDKGDLDRFNRAEAVWYEVNLELDKLTSSYYGNPQEPPIIAKIDEDLWPHILN